MALTTDREKCAHLLRRFGLGASEAELEYYLKDGGLKGAIAKLLNFEAVPDPAEIPIEMVENGKGQLKVPGVQAWWMSRLAATHRPLQEKLTLFWHDHFATSAAKVTSAQLMLNQNEILRRNAAGNFRTLLREVSKDAAMMYWLDNQYNVKGKPNENFAREVMELFTLGIGNYSEKDIQEAARAFTGWGFRQRKGPKGQAGVPKTTSFVFNAADHDDGEKTILGKTGRFTGDDVLDLLCNDPRTATFVAKKAWEWFAYEKPEPAIVERLASAFRDSGLNIRILVKTIMDSPEFYSARAERTVYKNPVDFVVPIVRQLGIGSTVASGQKANLAGITRPLSLSAKAMGMDILFPPDVAGWDGGAAWITSATMIERVKFADKVFGVAPPGIKGQKGGTNVNFRYPARSLFGDVPTAETIVDTLLSIYDAPLKSDKRPNLLAAAQKGLAAEGSNINAVAASVSRLIFGAPEFQFA